MTKKYILNNSVYIVYLYMCTYNMYFMCITNNSPIDVEIRIYRHDCIYLYCVHTYIKLLLFDVTYNIL